MPGDGALVVSAADPFADVAFINYEGFLTPATLFVTSDGTSVEPVKQLPEQFDAGRFAVEQHFAKSSDGTRIPYFLIRERDAPLKGDTPTVLYGYGGFEASMTPSYVGPYVQTWLENGGAWVVANIRGGGEYGPEWHKAVLKENRQLAFDDFIAVAEDLFARGVSGPNRLGIYGGSNGGLLVGAVMVQRPELFRTVACAVPLLDMLRYHKLLAGASWMGEYGDPDIPAERAFIEKYSPYQNVKREAEYPKVFFFTSTRDDRVHPGHARKMAAKMKQQGHDILYYENVDGGHSSAADQIERARRSAQLAVFSLRELMD
jgi:prolyl oligopeptidase